MIELKAVRHSLAVPNLGGTLTVKENPSYSDFTPSLESVYCQPNIRHRALTDLRSIFAEYQHRPSPAMWHALSDIAGVIESMAAGTCLANYYLSSLDPGVGKTQTLIQTIRTIVNDEAYRDVGIIVFLSRLEEIRALVKEGGLDHSRFATLTSDRNGLKEAGLGEDKVDEAQVLFTTQQRFENAVLNGRCFGECREFFYQGCPRQVRIWDESLVPGRSITVDRYDIAGLLGPLSKPFPELTNDLEAIFDDLKALPDRTFYDVPEFAPKHDVGPQEAVAAIADISEHRVDVIRSLWFLSGRRVTVRHDRKKRLFIDYRDFLPEDLAPLLILDASGRVRATYDFWEQRRKGLVKLRTGHKRYDNLTINVWRRSGSKGGWKKEAADLLDGIIAMIQSAPDEPWLIIHHLPRSVGFDLPKKLKAALPASSENLKFLPWGQHLATNAYKDISNVILAGTLFYPAPSIEALGRAASKHPSSDGAFSKDDCDQVELGEHKHHILQALCRGAVRGCVDGVCPPCTAYVIASPRSGIPQALGEIFPGAKVAAWSLAREVKDSIKGKAREAFEYVCKELSTNRNAVVPISEVARAIGYEKSNFKKIRKSPIFVEALAATQIAEVALARGRGFAVCVVAE